MIVYRFPCLIPTKGFLTKLEVSGIIRERAGFLAADRPDIVYTAKESCRFMAKPIELAMGSQFGCIVLKTPFYIYNK